MSEAHPDPIDVYVGQRIRARRREIKQSQEALGQAAGVTFQQVQKYENGTNRVSCSALARIAHSHGVSPGYYFKGLPFLSTDETLDDAVDTLLEATTLLSQIDGAYELLRTLAAMPTSRRALAMKVCMAMAGEGEVEL